MANLPQTKTEAQIKSLTVAKVKSEYLKLADSYNKIIDEDIILCHKCNSFVSRSNFYTSNEYSTGVFPICKKCLLAMVEQRNKKTDEPNETKESVQKVLRMMNLPYIDSLYESQCKIVANEVNEKNRKSPFLAYLVPLKSLPNWQGWTWEQSEFGNYDELDGDIKLNQKLIKAGKKRFGIGYSDKQYMDLEAEYEDWVNNYECNNKAQREVFQNLSLLKLQRKEALNKDKSTKDIDAAYQQWLDTGNLKPKQNASNNMNDNLTFGQMIEKWEQEEPVPEPDEQFKDVDGIGKYIRVWFKGALSRAMGLDNGYSKEYDDYIEQYTVKKLQDLDEDSEDVDNNVYNKLFGKDGE